MRTAIVEPIDDLEAFKTPTFLLQKIAFAKVSSAAEVAWLNKTLFRKFVLVKSFLI